MEMEEIKSMLLAVLIKLDKLVEAKEVKVEKLKKDIPSYPMAFESVNDSKIVLFTSINAGTIIKQGSEEGNFIVGYTTTSWIKHTDPTAWRQIPYDKDRGFYHGQLVYCWDNIDTHRVIIRFYDAINKCVFDAEGNISSIRFDNYSAVIPIFIKSGYDTLEGIRHA